MTKIIHRCHVPGNHPHPQAWTSPPGTATGAPRHARVSIPPRAHRASATCPSEHPLTTGRGGEPSPQHQAAKRAARRAGAAETPLGGWGAAEQKTRGVHGPRRAQHVQGGRTQSQPRSLRVCTGTFSAGADVRFNLRLDNWEAPAVPAAGAGSGSPEVLLRCPCFTRLLGGCRHPARLPGTVPLLPAQGTASARPRRSGNPREPREPRPIPQPPLCLLSSKPRLGHRLGGSNRYRKERDAGAGTAASSPTLNHS